MGRRAAPRRNASRSDRRRERCAHRRGERRALARPHAGWSSRPIRCAGHRVSALLPSAERWTCGCSWAGPVPSSQRPSRRRGDSARGPSGRLERSARCTATTRRRSWSTTGSRSSAASTSPRSRRPLRQRATRRAGRVGWHDVAHGARGPGGRRRRGALPHALARGHRRAPRARSDAAGAAGGRTVQVVRTVPERVYRRCRAGSSGSSRRTPCAALGRERLVYLENQFLWSPEIAESSATSCAARPRRPSGSCCCCRRSRTTAPTTRAACSPS